MLFSLCNLKLKKLLVYLTLICIICYIFVKLFSSRIFIKSDSTLPVLVWWTPFMLNDNRIITCGKEEFRCRVTGNRTGHNANLGVYMFYGSRIENHDFPLPRNAEIPWAVFHEESPKNYAAFLYEEAQTIFNITSTFSRKSDFPVTLQYLNDISELTDKTYYVSLKTKNHYLKELSPVLYIQSDCDTPIDRDHFVKKLAKYVKIDSYGQCLRNKSFPKELLDLDPLDLYNEQYMHFIAKYKFIIALENAICEDYITEKLWRPLIVGSVPIYLGSPTIKDWIPNRESAILVNEFGSIRTLGEYINKVNENDTMYEKFLQHKISKISNKRRLQETILDDNPILSFECFLCENIQRGSHIKYKSKNENIYNCPHVKSLNAENTWHQYWEIGKCQSKALKALIEKGEPYSKELFEETWKNIFHEKKC